MDAGDAGCQEDDDQKTSEVRHRDI
jgi:hypothetical protein